jgi:hypothetical protein
MSAESRWRRPGRPGPIHGVSGRLDSAPRGVQPAAAGSRCSPTPPSAVHAPAGVWGDLCERICTGKKLSSPRTQAGGRARARDARLRQMLPDAHGRRLPLAAAARPFRTRTCVHARQRRLVLALARGDAPRARERACVCICWRLACTPPPLPPKTRFRPRTPVTLRPPCRR